MYPPLDSDLFVGASGLNISPKCQAGEFLVLDEFKGQGSKTWTLRRIGARSEEVMAYLGVRD